MSFKLTNANWHCYSTQRSRLRYGWRRSFLCTGYTFVKDCLYSRGLLVIEKIYYYIDQLSITKTHAPCQDSNDWLMLSSTGSFRYHCGRIQTLDSSSFTPAKAWKTGLIDWYYWSQGSRINMKINNIDIRTRSCKSLCANDKILESEVQFWGHRLLRLMYDTKIIHRDIFSQLSDSYSLIQTYFYSVNILFTVYIRITYNFNMLNSNFE